MKPRPTALLAVVIGLLQATTLAAQFVRYLVTDESHIGNRGICLGPDGNIWFRVANRVGRITPVGTITTYDLLTERASHRHCHGPRRKSVVSRRGRAERRPHLAHRIDRGVRDSGGERRAERDRRRARRRDLVLGFDPRFNLAVQSFR